MVVLYIIIGALLGYCVFRLRGKLRYCATLALFLFILFVVTTGIASLGNSLKKVFALENEQYKIIDQEIEKILNE